MLHGSQHCLDWTDAVAAVVESADIVVVAAVVADCTCYLGFYILGINKKEAVVAFVDCFVYYMKCNSIRQWKRGLGNERFFIGNELNFVD